MAQDTPFGRTTRMRVLDEYFAQAGAVSAENAWEHVYRCLLWINPGAGLAHIYDSNHMQRQGVFHSRAVRFTELLCAHWSIEPAELPGRIDHLFRGCVADLTRRTLESGMEAGEETGSELISAIEAILLDDGIAASTALTLARKIEALSRNFFTIGNKRKNAPGEGFEDLLGILLQRVCQIPAAQISLREPVSKLPGFRRAAPVQADGRRQREPHPDIAVTEGGVTHVITTAKWSMRQDRETQFQSEYSAFQMNKVQPAELTYVLITNEFDIARLKNVARAMPGGEGGYIFHTIYHICLPLLRQTHGARFADIEPWVGTGKLRSLSDFLTSMRLRYGGS
nr:hypothetical protein [uncultured Rhodopila sp.]